jgi:hypothetical protein
VLVRAKSQPPYVSCVGVTVRQVGHLLLKKVRNTQNILMNNFSTPLEERRTYWGLLYFWVNLSGFGTSGTINSEFEKVGENPKHRSLLCVLDYSLKSTEMSWQDDVLPNRKKKISVGSFRVNSVPPGTTLSGSYHYCSECNAGYNRESSARNCCLDEKKAKKVPVRERTYQKEAEN